MPQVKFNKNLSESADYLVKLWENVWLFAEKGNADTITSSRKQIHFLKILFFY